MIGEIHLRITEDPSFAKEQVYFVSFSYILYLILKCYGTLQCIVQYKWPLLLLLLWKSCIQNKITCIWVWVSLTDSEFRICCRIYFSDYGRCSVKVRFTICFMFGISVWKKCLHLGWSLKFTQYYRNDVYKWVCYTISKWHNPVLI